MKTPVSASLLALVLLAGCGQATTDAPAAATAPGTAAQQPTPTPANTLQEAIDSEVRSPEEKSRDVWRHPKETLEFLGVEPSDTVVEIWPGGGWYTNILAPWLAAGGGQLVEVLFDPAGIDDPERLARIQKNDDAFKANYVDPRFGTIRYSGFSANSGALTEPGTADVVLTFRNIHNWMPREAARPMLQAMYDALKPGGILGVVEHRAGTGAPQDPQARSGYVREDYAIELIESIGFRLVGRSEVNANPADTRDYEQGVWTLPPTLRLGDKDRDRYVAIGESDRFTLRFEKPRPSG